MARARIVPALLTFRPSHEVLVKDLPTGKPLTLQGAWHHPDGRVAFYALRDPSELHTTVLRERLEIEIPAGISQNLNKTHAVRLDPQNGTETFTHHRAD